MHPNESEKQPLRLGALQTAEAAVQARQRAEREAVEAQNRVTSILESITDAFFALDQDWRFTYINQRGAEMLQVLRSTTGDLLGRNIWEEFPAALGTEFEKQYRRAMEERIFVSFEAPYGSADRWFDVRVYPSQEGFRSIFTRSPSSGRQRPGCWPVRSGCRRCSIRRRSASALPPWTADWRR